MRNLLFLGALALTACPGPGQDSDTAPETQEDINARMFADIVYVTDAPIALDDTCWSDGDAWLTQTVDPDLVMNESRTLEVLDFESDARVTEADVAVYFGDDVDMAPDFTGVSDVNGQLTTDVPSCAPFAYKVSTPPEREQTKDTYEAHQIFGPIAVDTDGAINSVSRTTFLLIPSLQGVTVDADKSIIAGGFRDCTGEPIENAQVIVRDADGNIPESLVVKYFIENFPARDQEWTSADGLWVAINVPPGPVTAEAWVSDGAGGHILAGKTVVVGLADSINISNIYLGREDGIFYPDGCLATPVPN